MADVSGFGVDFSPVVRYSTVVSRACAILVISMASGRRLELERLSIRLSVKPH